MEKSVYYSYKKEYKNETKSLIINASINNNGSNPSELVINELNYQRSIDPEIKGFCDIYLNII